MWTKEKIWQWYKKQRWIVGFNHLPTCAVNSTEMWQKESFNIGQIEKELQLASSVGFNTSRVFIQYIVWKDQRDAFFECFDMYLNAAARCGIRVIPVLFDDCAMSFKEPYLGVQDAPVKGIHNSGWTPSPGFVNADSEAEQDLLKTYVTDFISRYAEDDRILVWDLYNEAGGRSRGNKSVELLRNAFGWARACNATQPLTACICVNAAWKECNDACAELSDIISFHDYLPLPETKESVALLENYGRPLLCTEWLHRPNDNRFDTHMPYYKKKGIGIVNWGLVAGKTQTYYDWDRSKNPLDGKPEVWQHDIYNEDLTPYCQKEIDLIKALTGSAQ